MNNDLKQFMEKTFPTGTKIKIDRAANDDIVGKTYIVDRIDDNGLYCSTESGNVVLIDPDESTFYKLDQPPIVAYGCDDEPAELTDVRQISEFIINNGLYGDISMYKKDTGEFVLSTMGIFIDQIADMDFRNELLTILVPLQQQFPFGMPDEQDNEETEATEWNKRKIFNYSGTQVYFEISDYESDPAIMAITLFTSDGEEFGTLSVNVWEHGHIEPNQTFIDTNNMPNAVEFLESIKGVEPVTENGVPVTAKSGFCEYPLFEFSEELLADMDLKGYMEHIHNYDRALTDMTKEMTMGG
ncbi:DUF4313 domain-containing protein [Ruminococcus sp.]|uniref:DUF4313 domain-containing protein n=1 Tax=Ruminococcus sp. TaxID=41978 RepID=UPI001B0519EC|nr:DUF4313 domain-containing protein [Ruminococcus sp.]MBO5559082.1 DUF4313 domain-containing protein [Ruminococcus sp.]